MFGALLLVHPRAKKTAATDRGERVKKRQNWCWKDWGPKVPVWKSSCISTCGLLFSHQIMSNSSRPHGLHHSRLPCPSPSPRVGPSACSLHWWCHPAISPSDSLLSSCPQFFPASGTFPMNCLFTSGDQNTGTSGSASDSPVNIQGWSPFSPRDSQESSPTPQFKSINSSVFNVLHVPTLTSLHDYWKNCSFDIRTFVGKVMFLLLNTLSMFVITFLPRRKCLLISWLQSPSAVILEPKKIKSVTASIVSHLFAMKWWHQIHDLSFLNAEF